MNSHTFLFDIDALEKLHAEINRLQASQKLMRDANRALIREDDVALRSMGFSEEHIAELKFRLSTGRRAFPDYLFRNNENDIRSLKKCLVQITERATVAAGLFSSSAPET